MEGRPHVVMVPYPVQGHINPLFAFARSLVSIDIEVTFVHTARNYKLLQQQRLSSVDDTNSLQDSRLYVEAIPEKEEDEDRTKLREEEDPAYQHSLQRLERGLQKVVERVVRERPRRVRAMVADMLMPWTRVVAKRAGIEHWFQFSGFPALAYLAAYYVPRLMDMGMMPLKPGSEDTPLDFAPVRPALRLGDVPIDLLRRDVRNLEVVLRIFDPQHMRDTSGLVINTIYDLEASAVEAMQMEVNLPVYPVGPLLCSVEWTQPGRTKAQLVTWSTALLPEDQECVSWLDRQPPRSVVYVAFGSLATLLPQEAEELAYGLEACGLRFLWVLRPKTDDDPDDSDPDNNHNNQLPPGFATRTRERGLVVGWSPQARVLAHPSAATFITHCGCSSMLEALSAGVPMIGYPKLSEQNTNLKLITEWGVGIPLRAPLSRHDVASSLHCIVHGEQGRAARHKASQLRAVINNALVEPDGLSRRFLTLFASHLTVSHDDACPHRTFHPQSSLDLLVPGVDSLSIAR